MRCEHVSEMMSARLDGRLDDTESALLEDHLAGCATCQAAWQSMQALDCLLAAAPTVRAPLRLRVQVMARLHRRDQARRAIAGGTTLTLGTVTLALLGLAPAFLDLLNAAGIAPALVSAGPETLTQLLGFLGAASRTLLVLVERLAVPLAFLSLCSLSVALALNSLWRGALRLLRTTH
jgi:anti-sigma factor RsiW